MAWNATRVKKRKQTDENMKKRSRHSILSQILDICKSGASKTRIVYQANLNFRTVNPYINTLIRNDLIEIKRGKTVVYETTTKGENLLESFRLILDEITDL